MLEGFWISGVSRECEIRILVIHGSISDDLIWLVVFPVYALWGVPEGMWFLSVLGGYGIGRWPEMG